MGSGRAARKFKGQTRSVYILKPGGIKDSCGICEATSKRGEGEKSRQKAKPFGNPMDRAPNSFLLSLQGEEKN